MWWHGELWTIAAVESSAKRVMGNHDFQPRHKRDQANGIIGHFEASKNCRAKSSDSGGPPNPGPSSPSPLTITSYTMGGGCSSLRP
jgi:hypothetical protein